MRDLICLDMGGTTAKASRDRGRRAGADAASTRSARGSRCRAQLSKGRGYAIKLPVLEIAEVGAGGGSIVGPTGSARSSSGRRAPARCPGRSATRRAVTRGHGHRRERRPRVRQPGGDRRRHDRDPPGAGAARRSMTDVAAPLGLSVEDAAHGVFGVAVATMARAVKAVTTFRGRDPRDFTLLAFGGNGPIFAAALAESLGHPHTSACRRRPASSRRSGCSRPRRPGTARRSIFQVGSRIDPAELAAHFATLESGGALRSSGPNGAEHARVDWGADVRYAQQGYELAVAVDRAGPAATLVDSRPLGVRRGARAGIRPRVRAGRDRAGHRAGFGRRMPRDSSLSRAVRRRGAARTARGLSGSGPGWGGWRCRSSGAPCCGRRPSGRCSPRSSTRRRSCRRAGERGSTSRPFDRAGARCMTSLAPAGRRSGDARDRPPCARLARRRDGADHRPDRLLGDGPRRPRLLHRAAQPARRADRPGARHRAAPRLVPVGGRRDPPRVSLADAARRRLHPQRPVRLGRDPPSRHLPREAGLPRGATGGGCGLPRPSHRRRGPDPVIELDDHDRGLPGGDPDPGRPPVRGGPGQPGAARHHRRERAGPAHGPRRPAGAAGGGRRGRARVPRARRAATARSRWHRWRTRCSP